MQRNVDNLMAELKEIEFSFDGLRVELIFHMVLQAAEKFSVRLESIHQQEDNSTSILFHHLDFSRNPKTDTYSYDGRNVIRAIHKTLSPEDTCITEEFHNMLSNAPQILPKERLEAFSRRREIFRKAVVGQLEKYRKKKPELFHYLLGMVLPISDFQLTGKLSALQQQIAKEYINACYIPSEDKVSVGQSDAVLTGNWVYVKDQNAWMSVDMKADPDDKLNQPLIRVDTPYAPLAIINRHALFEIPPKEQKEIDEQLQMGRPAVLPARHFARSAVVARTDPVEGSIHLAYQNGKDYAHLYPDKWLYHHTYQKQKQAEQRQDPGHRNQVTQRRGNKRHVELRQLRHQPFANRRKK